ncbi:MAG: hypothetical protein KF744_06620 [Taibaiella sp.]|nr:hypothetical protein [Taibaiella sp.]
MFRWPLAVLFMILPFGIQAQPIENTRTPYTLKLVVDEENFFESEIAAGKYVNGQNAVQVYPGESILLEADLKDGKIGTLSCVKENLHPERTITVSFMQHTTGKKHELMMLEVTNPFSERLSYQAGIYLMKSEKWVKTSVLPILPKLKVYETWPDMIVSIALTDWALGDK